MIRNPRARRAVRLALPLALALGLLGGWAASARRPRGTARDWAEVRRGDLVETVAVTGELEAVASLLIGPPSLPDTWEYKIADMVPEGTAVAAGTPVLRFDTETLERQLAEKRAERDAAQQEIEKKRTELALAHGEDAVSLAEAEARRRKADLKARVPPELAAGIDRAEALADLALAGKEVAYRGARLGLAARQGAAELGSLLDRRDRAAARVREVEASIERSTLRAPRAGTVIYVADSQGQKKRIGDSCWQMQKVLELPDLSKLRARGEVEEADIGRIAAGQPVRLALDALPDVNVAGRVEAVDRAVREERGRARSAGKVIEVEIALDVSGERRVRPGMRFRGTIEVARAKGVLLVPAEAVLPSPDGPRLLRRSFWGFTEVRPKLGRRTRESFEVVAGLSAGDFVARRDLGEEAR
ncbi:MAG TPA: HlyD family efflux transporter periplasmic adaptor subunit [Thermoanaerobaculia bacterium]|nr:HlyD family efflux transporter periplasmic adaptor subunit [Thermoanaerobaculia bacterium]